MKPLRVLQAVIHMPLGGLESMLMNIYRNIDRKRIQFDFLTFKKESAFFDEEIKSLGGNVFYGEPLGIRDIYSCPWLRSFFLEHQEYKIIHTHMHKWYSGIVLKNAKLAQVPIRIAHSHTTSFGKFNIKNVVKNITKLPVNQYATIRLACSKKAGYWLFGKKVVNDGQLMVWPNAIECDKFRYNVDVRKRVRAELGLSDAYTLIHVGNLNVVKNQNFVIGVFDELAKKIPNTKLLLVGEDRMNGKYQKYAAGKNSIDSIMFLGRRTDIAELLQAGDVFVFPSHHEGFGIVILEALAAGLPCIISNTIPEEVCLTDNVVQLPINRGTEIWVNKILEFKDTQRTDNYNILVKKGYDIHTFSEYVCEFYENQWSKLLTGKKIVAGG